MPRNTPTAELDRFGGTASATASNGSTAMMTTWISRRCVDARLPTREARGIRVLLPMRSSSGNVFSSSLSPRFRNSPMRGRSMGIVCPAKLKTRGRL